MLKKDRRQQRVREVKLQALDGREAPRKCQVFRAKCTLGLGTVTVTTTAVRARVQFLLPRPAKTERRVSLLNPALEGATCYALGYLCHLLL